MKNLEKFSPAEVSVLLHGSFPPQKELLKMTFQDLLVRGILKTSTPGDNAEAIYVERGEVPTVEALRVHEYVFTLPFNEDKELMWPLPGYIKEVVKIVRKGSSLRKEILRRYLNEYAAQSWWQGLWGTFTLTRRGERAVDELRGEIEKLREVVLQCKDTDPDRIKEISSRIGANIFLVTEADELDHSAINKELIAAIAAATYVSSTGGAYGCGGDGYWDSSVDSAFDSGYDSGDGCGGDSGCSGCGGGCGGD